MEPWVIDAADFLEHNENLEIKMGDLTTTNAIELFLNSDKVNFIIAPKGFGKTVILIYRRLLYNFNKKSGFKFIPSNIGSLVDVPKGGAADLDWGELKIDFYKDRRNWETLWRACISLSIIQAIKKGSIGEVYKNKEDIEKLEKIRNDKDGLKYPLLRRLIYIEEYRTPIAYLNYILNNFKQDEIKALLKEQQFMDEVISEIQTPIAVFIDNIDEYFQEHSEKDKQDYNPSIRGIFDIDLWYASQHGLMFAIKNMCRTVHHLDIFATIRKEAYEKLSGTMVENIRGHCLDNIQYSSDKLKEIFENNIKWTDKKFLVKTEEVHSKPIISLFGYDKIKNESTGEEEEIFDFIYRHTLKRPRDIVRIGWELVRIDTKERTQQNVRDTINRVATQIAGDYIKLFVPHTCFNSESEVINLFKLIPHNILNLKNLENICCTFNGRNIKSKRDCKNCNMKHFFCDLYKLGLLGTVEFDINANKYKQKFLIPGEKTFESNILPTSLVKDYYLIHPSLNDLIGGAPETRINKSVTIGDNRGWTDPMLPDFLNKKYKTFADHSNDDKSLMDIPSKDLQKSTRYGDEININIHDLVRDSGNSTVDLDEKINTNIHVKIKIDLPAIQFDFRKFKREVEKLDADLKEELEDLEKDLLEITPKSDQGMINKAMNKLSTFMQELSDENSKFNKIIKSTKRGSELAQKLAKTYNKFAQYLALPHVPDLFFEK